MEDLAARFVEERESLVSRGLGLRVPASLRSLAVRYGRWSLAEGSSMVSAAARLGVSRLTLSRWFDESGPESSESFLEMVVRTAIAGGARVGLGPDTGDAGGLSDRGSGRLVSAFLAAVVAMIGPGRAVRVYARACPTDLRKGFAGLSALVREGLGDPTSGSLYLFVSRGRTKAKALWWDGTGLCLLSKQLEQGRFASFWEGSAAGPVDLSAAELQLFLEGCQLVWKTPLSPREVNPKRFIAEDLYDIIRMCSMPPARPISRF